MNYRFAVSLFLLSAFALTSALARAESCAGNYDQLGAVYSSKEIKQIKELQEIATSKIYSAKQRTAALEELLDLTQSRLKDLGFKTRRRTFDNDYMLGGKETFLQILEAPNDLPIGRVINRAKERYGLKVGINPILEKSGMDTPAYFSTDDNLTILDALVFRDKAEVPQDFLHEIRHRYYLQLLKDGKANVHHGFVTALKKNYHLETPGGSYDKYISFEELSTYYRDAVVALSKLARGKQTKKYTREVLNDLRRLSGGIIKAVDELDFALDLSKIKVDYRGKTIFYPIYDGARLKKNLVAEITYPMPEITKDMSKAEVMAAFTQDMLRLRAIAEERIEFAEGELGKFGERNSH